MLFAVPSVACGRGSGAVGHSGIGGLLVVLAVVVVIIKRQEPKKTNQVS